MNIYKTNSKQFLKKKKKFNSPNKYWLQYSPNNFNVLNLSKVKR